MTLLLWSFLAGCMPPWDPAWSLTTDTDDTDDTNSDDDDTAGGGGGDDSGDTEELPVVLVEEDISSSTTWDNEHVWVLDRVIYVTGGTLTIEPGTLIKGELNSALVVTRNANINAIGRPDNPIVFTSAQPVGSRARADWGGLALLGQAPSNNGIGQIEGLDERNSYGTYGGSVDGHNCGALDYVRIEFAGYEIGSDNELNALTLGGCGTGTLLRHIQVHMTKDDGIEFFGGHANLEWAVISRPGDDGLDWDKGWDGKVQFLIIQQEADAGDNGFEADNQSEIDDDKSTPKIDESIIGPYDLTPRSSPTIYNLTMIGSRDDGTAQRAINLGTGTAAVIQNALIAGFTAEAIDIQQATTGELLESGVSRIGNIAMVDVGDGGVGYFPDEAGEDDDNGFDEEAYFTTEAENITVGSASAVSFFPADDNNPAEGTAYNLVSPGFVPRAVGWVDITDGATPPQDSDGDFFDRGATYLGAVDPDGSDMWYEGWTDFPEN